MTINNHLVSETSNSIIKVSSSCPSTNPNSRSASYSSPSSKKVISPRASNMKRVEQGLIQYFSSSKFILYFEIAPFWIFSLNKSFCAEIHFPEFKNFHSLALELSKSIQGPAIEKILLHHFGKSILSFGTSSSVNSNTITLINGSIPFAENIVFVKNIRDSWLFIADTVIRHRKLPATVLNIHRARHSVFGGPTSSELIWASSLSSFLPVSTTMRRNIGDFIKYSLRLKPVDMPPPSYAVDYQSLLPIGMINRPIVYPSTFTRTGYGIRPLSSEELCFVFGLPALFLKFVDENIFPFPPVQVSSSILKQFLGCITSPSNIRRNASTCIPTPLPVPDDSVTYLENLKLILPPAWKQNKRSTEKAAKSDDAEVDYSLWNDRILSIWPVFRAALTPLRALVMRYQKRKLYLEFRSYLRSTYSQVYLDYLKLRFSLYRVLFSTKRAKGGLFKDLLTQSSVAMTKKSKNDHLSKSNTNLLHFSSQLQMKKFDKLSQDIIHGTQSLKSYLGSDYFSWSNGSTLLFWRWHPNLRNISKLGFQPQISGILPTNKRPARTPSKEVYEKLYSKILKGINRSYLKFIPSWKVKNLIDYFAVPKADDIRMVQNGSSCGLNESVWSSNFWLPMASSMLRVLGYNYKSVDIDLGEMFLNFPLAPHLIPYSVMDITPFRNKVLESYSTNDLPDKKKVYVANTRCWMGFRPSPEWSCRFYYLAEEFIRGNEADPNNPLHWSEIKLNLIGNKDYNPSLPNVMKWNGVYNRIAGDIKAFVDDLRALGWSLDHAWEIAHLIASRLQYLGIQDAPRKRRIDNGPWAGCIYISTDTKVQRTVTVDKWTKGKGYIEDLNDLIYVKGLTKLNFKYLEKIRGYLCHLAMTFNILFPYLKGFHQTLCSYLPKRNEDGWKIRDLEWLGYLEEEKASGRMSEKEMDTLLNFKYDPKDRPESINLLPRFFTCLEALTLFFEVKDPPIITERSSEVNLLVYGFVDASKSGFGASIDYDNLVRYRIGIWGVDEQSESSNYREFANLVETLEQEFTEGRLKNQMVIMATDNSTVEAAIFKGNSTSKKLFDLVVRFRVLELKSSCNFIVTHVSGVRMQLQGTDGISRGNLMEGISLGRSMLHFCPWGISALKRCSKLKPWLLDTFGSKLEILKPSDWFSRGHDHWGGYYDNQGFYRLNIKPGLFLWEPPPTAADAAIEEIRKARLKRRSSGHIIVIPKLATTLWLKQVYKAADIVLTIPPIHEFWDSNMCESLVVALLFPYSRSFPWQVRSTPKLIAASREMRSLFKESPMANRIFLRKFYLCTTRLLTLQPCVVRRVLYFESKCKVPLSQSRGFDRGTDGREPRSTKNSTGVGKEVEK